MSAHLRIVPEMEFETCLEYLVLKVFHHRLVAPAGDVQASAKFGVVLYSFDPRQHFGLLWQIVWLSTQTRLVSLPKHWPKHVPLRVT